MAMSTRPDPTKIYMLVSPNHYNKYGIHNGIRSARSAVKTQAGSYYTLGPNQIYHLIDNEWVLEYDLPQIPYTREPINWELYRVKES